jgi:hypothetical protein
VVAVAACRVPGGAAGGDEAGEGLGVAQGLAEALGGGSTKREIAEKLGIKFSTVNTLVTRIYRKLGVTRRAQLVNVIRNGG